MPRLGCTSLVVVARLTDRKAIHPWLAVSGHATLLGQELVLLLGTSCSRCTPTGAAAPSSGSWQHREQHTAANASSIFVLNNLMQGEFNASIAYTAHKVKMLGASIK